MGFAKRIVCEGISYFDQGQEYAEWERRMVECMGPEVRHFLRDAFQWVIIYVQRRQGSTGHKLNCWDVMRCGHRPDNGKKKPRDQCPACNEFLLNGIHGGKNGGRACWAINGTTCGGKRQRRFEKKQDMCLSCPFYGQVMREEGPDHLLKMDFLRMLVEYG